jgi:leucyl aminopeptidase (aminopeptidase T)
MSHLKFAEWGHRVIKILANAREGERVLILGDTTSNSDMLEAIFASAIQAQCEASLLIYRERPHINYEPPGYIAEAMKGVDLVVDFSTQYMIHTRAYQAARESGTRCLVTIPEGIDEYIRRGVAAFDYAAMVREGERLTEAIASAKVCRITSEAGTDIQMEINGRPVLHRDGMVVHPREIDYFPGSQISFAPIEETLNGNVFVDGTISPPLGKLNLPVEFTLEKGKIVEIKGGPEATKWQDWLKSLDDPKMFCMAHVSVGMNPEAQLRGYIVEDERIRGSLTVGIGSQIAEFGGTVGRAKTHCDAVSLMATVKLDDRVVVEKGNILV